MTVIDNLQAFRGYDVSRSSASLWVFKKRPVSGNINPFAAISVLMSDNLQDQLKEVVLSYQLSHTTEEAYNLLAQTSEGGFLSFARAETLFPDLQKWVDLPHEEHLAKSEKQLNNAAGYVFKLRLEDKLIYCVKKTTSDWATRKKKDYMNIFFKESGLDIIESPSFSIAKQFDFFVIGEHVLMTNKASFESLLNHRDSYEEAYAELKQEPGFIAAISDMTPIDAFVGRNATQLRRMTVIRARGYYNNPNYLSRLREVSNARDWGIQFDGTGRIVPTEESMRAIMHILLDHRLRSELSDNQYDVPSTSPIG